MRKLITMRRALESADLFGPLLGADTWRAWRLLLIALAGEALTDGERELFRALTEREREPLAFVECFVGIIGRRGGKSRAMACLACFVAALCDFEGAIAPGERPMVLCLSQSAKQARIIFGYVVAAFESVPALAGLISQKMNESLVLTNGVSIEVRAASYRGIRGVTALAILCDETCFWASADEGSENADSEIIAAARPALATTQGPLILISSPFARRGATWELYAKHYGPAGDPLIMVAQGPSQAFNPSLPQRVVDRAYEVDPISAASEFGTLETGIQWRSDVCSFIDPETVAALVVADRFELPPQDGVRYAAFCDPAGGSGQDSMTIAVAHSSGERVIIDAVREIRPKFNPSEAVSEFAALLKQYRVSEIVGDKYAGSWCSEAFTSVGITYEASAAPKNALYRDALAMLMSGRVELLDHRRLVAQLTALERRSGRLGDVIDHPRNGHDDIVNAVLGVAVTLQLAKQAPTAISVPFRWR